MNKTENHSNIDIIKGDPKRAIRKLSVPMMISMLLIFIYNLVDSIWVAGLGSDALAALGFVTPLFMIMVGLGNGIGAGANSLIARCIGANDKPTADNAALHSVLITIILSIIIPMLIVPILKPILLSMGAGSSVQLGLDYGNIVFGLMFVFIFSGVGAAILRSEGDVNRAMYVMAITAVLNIVLDPIFIYTFNMGIAGAAWASILSAGISCIVMGYWLWIKKDTYLNLEKKSFKYKGFIVKEILKVTIPATAENLIVSILVMSMNTMLVLVASNTAVAVYTAGMRIVQMAMIPLIGLGTAILTVAGASYGAHDYNKLSEGFNYSIKIGMLISISLGILLYLASPYISLIFAYSSTSAYLAPQISNLIRILCLFLLTMPLGIMSSMTFQGVGRGMTSLIITIFRSLIFELVFAYLAGFIFNLGEVGMYYGLVLGAALGCFFALGWAKLFINHLTKSMKKKFSEKIIG